MLSTLRIIGFSLGQVRFLVMSEALFICLLAGTTVALGALRMGASWHLAGQALGLSVLLGILGGAIPTLIAGKSRLAEALRKIV